jgi:hypothetical protein
VESISAGKAKCVRDLLQIRNAEGSRLSDEEVIEIVEQMMDSGQIALRRSAPEFESFFGFMVDLPRSWAFWFLFAITLVTLLSVYYLPSSVPWSYVRWLGGTLFLGFAPGLGLVRLLFGPRHELDDADTVALSVGLSLAVSSLIGILLNFLPGGISLDSIVLAIATLVIFLACTSAARDYSFLRRPRK